MKAFYSFALFTFFRLAVISMKKLVTALMFLIVFLPLVEVKLSAISPAQVPNIKSFSRYSWTIDKLGISYTALNETEQEAVNHILGIASNLEGSSLEIITGKILGEIIYIFPLLITANDLDFDAEAIMVMLGESLNLTPEEAEELEFTIPKGSGIPLHFLIYSLMYGIDSKVFNERVINNLAMYQYPYPTLPAITGIPYNISEVSDAKTLFSPIPIPFVDAGKFSQIASEWDNLNTTYSWCENITFSHEETAAEITFTASGYQNSSYSYGNYKSMSYFEIDLTITYYKNTGVLKSYSVRFLTDYKWYNGTTLKEHQRVDAEYGVSFSSFEEVDFDLGYGEKIGLRLVEISMSDTIIDALSNILVEANVTNTPEEAREFIQNITTSLQTLNMTYHYLDKYSNGIDLFFNATHDILLPNGTLATITLPTYQSAFILGSVYLMPVWDVQYSLLQTSAHSLINIIPKFIRFGIRRQDPRFDLEVTGDYGVYATPNNEWVSLYANYQVTFSCNETSSDTIKFTINLGVEQWWTYEGKGRLTEEYTNVSAIIEADVNKDGTIQNNETFSGWIRVLIQRAAYNPETGEIAWSQTIDAPNPVGKEAEEAGYEDVTPYRVAAPPPPPVLGIPMEYLIAGVLFIIAIVIIIIVARRPKE